MKHLYEHLSLEEAKQMQLQLAHQVSATDELGPVTYVAGVDVGYNLHTQEQTACAVLFNVSTNTVEHIVTATTPTFFPYVTGFLSFREIPTILAALYKLPHKPDLILCDGQGIAHPRGLGIASHLGIILDIPTIGCGKSILVGHAAKPGLEKGSQTPLMYRTRCVGMAVRTRTNCRPIYISSGHRVSLVTAVAWVLKLTTRYRSPDVIHIADRTVKRLLHPKK